MSDFVDRLAFRPQDSIEDIQFKLQHAQEHLEAERSKRMRDRMPLYEAYLENAVRVFGRDIQRRSTR